MTPNPTSSSPPSNQNLTSRNISPPTTAIPNPTVKPAYPAPRNRSLALSDSEISVLDLGPSLTANTQSQSQSPQSEQQKETGKKHDYDYGYDYRYGDGMGDDGAWMRAEPVTVNFMTICDLRDGNSRTADGEGNENEQGGKDAGRVSAPVKTSKGFLHRSKIPFAVSDKNSL
ncbi:hypothetical protein ASPWEDRAFT_45539 [Aspergillus wentii DTO 134E9]|uniref:Uncharacterized protein n=1 Tax=Aspergillus wentii DTO 134E9 TaxID=1073089 RepID=A0A1L9R9L3_ASPWE|nr:uncharacterized protein ASPWEDRAFT_45539 [Aspergillus wentii DTO 134E9]KAI9926387.1 hypothetical protein MW887_004151 [Aspergillus wentii]OJJ31578.1 hypothetical protein ASPWEDRAFT_45539 [Aspergillus wentii DTO 134E9]